MHAHAHPCEISILCTVHCVLCAVCCMLSAVCCVLCCVLCCVMLCALLLCSMYGLWFVTV
jgi:hypothetical protein